MAGVQQGTQNTYLLCRASIYLRGHIAYCTADCIVQHRRTVFPSAFAPRNEQTCQNVFDVCGRGISQ